MFVGFPAVSDFLATAHHTGPLRLPDIGLRVMLLLGTLVGWLVLPSLGLLGATVVTMMLACKCVAGHALLCRVSR
jgi:hypothetical protein